MRINTLHLKEIIYAALKTYTDNVYFQLASNTSELPVVVYDLPAVYNRDNTGLWRGVLTVDVYHTDPVALEELVYTMQDLNLRIRYRDIYWNNPDLEWKASTLLWDYKDKQPEGQPTESVVLYLDDIQYINSEDATDILRKRLNFEYMI